MEEWTVQELSGGSPGVPEHVLLELTCPLGRDRRFFVSGYQPPVCAFPSRRSFLFSSNVSTFDVVDEVCKFTNRSFH